MQTVSECIVNDSLAAGLRARYRCRVVFGMPVLTAIAPMELPWALRRRAYSILSAG